jgi:hypothetical protein
MPYPVYPRRPDDAPAPFGFVPPGDPAYLADADQEIPAPTNTNAAVIGRATRIAPWLLKELIRRAQQGLDIGGALTYALDKNPEGGGGDDDPYNSPECEKERADTKQFCMEELTKRDQDNRYGITGRYTDVEDCMKGNLSEKCGGGVYVRPLYTRPRPRPKPRRK